MKDQSSTQASIRTSTDVSTQNEQPDGQAFLASATVAIVGLGLMGGSLALALRGHCKRLLGIDLHTAVVDQALSLQVVDEASTDPGLLLPQADLIVLAVPVRAILTLLRKLPALHPGTALVFDLGSTKQAVVNAMQELPARFDPLGCHPMCGKESSTLANAEAELYHGAPFALVPLPRTSTLARQVAVALAAVIGAYPLWLQSAEHDRMVAATSHLPYLLAAALSLSTPFEVAPLIGPGFRSTSRLAQSSVEMSLDILATNGTPVLEALSRYRKQLEILEDALHDNDLHALEHLLNLAADRRRALLSGVK